MNKSRIELKNQRNQAKHEKSLRNISLVSGIDCFKTLTRNPEKLLAMIEFILSKNAPLVSTNFYIENGYVSMTNNFIKPSNGTQQGVIKNFKDRIKIGGILPEHMEWLNDYIQQLELTNQ